MVLILSKSLLELFQRNLVVFNDTVDLELLDTVSDIKELVTTPDKTFNLNGLNVSQHLVNVSLIIPRLDINGDNGLGSSLGSLSSLLSSVLSKSLLLQLLSLLIDFLIVGSKEINILVLLLFSINRAKVRGLSVLVTGKSLKVSRESLNLGVPSGSLRVLGSRGRTNSLENNNISLGRRRARELLDRINLGN